MMLRFGRIAVVSTAALTLAVAAIPFKAEAADYFPGGYGYGGGYYRGGCGCQAYVPPPPPPPPPCCRVYTPPPCCVYGDGWNRDSYYGGGYGGGYYGARYGGDYGY